MSNVRKNGINNLEKEYKKKFDMLGEHYGINFEIDYEKDNKILDIKFLNLSYNSLKNVLIIYDNKYELFNYIQFEYEDDDVIKYISSKRNIREIVNANKLNYLVAEIKKLNKNFINERNMIKTDNSDKNE